MSYNRCDYEVCNNNNILNDNVFNMKKENKSAKKIYQLKQLIKPLLVLLKKNKNTYRKQPQPNYFDDEENQEINDNLANELLENEIFEEIDLCDEFSGVPVYSADGHMDILPVFRGQRYIPVNFAKTEAGTFFWTSMVGADCDFNIHGDKNAICNHQRPEIQALDRWAQA